MTAPRLARRVRSIIYAFLNQLSGFAFGVDIIPRLYFVVQPMSIQRPLVARILDRATAKRLRIDNGGYLRTKTMVNNTAASSVATTEPLSTIDGSRYREEGDGGKGTDNIGTEGR